MIIQGNVFTKKKIFQIQFPVAHDTSDKKEDTQQPMILQSIRTII